MNMKAGKISPAQNEPHYGAKLSSDGVCFCVRAPQADAVHIALFDDDGDREISSIPMQKRGDDFHASVSGLKAGARYGYRASGEYAPEKALFFDSSKLLVDPYALRIDRPYQYHPSLGERPNGFDTAPLMPKSVVVGDLPEIAHQPPIWHDGGLVYEANIRSLTMRHPAIPTHERGTLAALRHPAIIAHLKKIGVTALELMPIVAWIDERHLGPLGLTNAWGYNPVTFFALDPRMAPRGIADLRETVAALHSAGIGVILDLVYNHTGESDLQGPTLSMRGLDNQTFYRHAQHNSAELVNDTGCGNTIACDAPSVRAMVLDSLRHFVRHAAIDGFRFDLAPIMGRTEHGFDANAALLAEMKADPILGDRILIAEPWDIGPGGYQLGNFGAPFLEWNDRARDDLRRFWRGDDHMMGALATRLSGSADIFKRDDADMTRSVNFLAAHDGFSLADMVAYQHKHNHANGEDNRDGHNENLSWNNGVEGATDDQAIKDARHSDLKALLSTLFATRGAIMLTAGDEFGRTQQGNNNAYAQDNEMTWLDWEGRDRKLENHVALLAGLRRTFSALGDPQFLTGQISKGALQNDDILPDVVWLNAQGQPMPVYEWEAPRSGCLTMMLSVPKSDGIPARRLGVVFNRTSEPLVVTLGRTAKHHWLDALTSLQLDGDTLRIMPRSVGFYVETPDS